MCDTVLQAAFSVSFRGESVLIMRSPETAIGDRLKLIG